jgi:hypothetical protein
MRKGLSTTKKTGPSFGVIVFLLVLAAFGCNASNNIVPPPVAGSSPVTFTVTDTPPAGVTLLAFEVTVTNATLSPGNVPLVVNPVKIEVRRLETESAFLATVNVPAGTYQSVAVTFSNPELTFLNQTGSAIGVCANNSICEIKSNSSSNVSYSGAPFPVTITNNTPGGLRLDLNVANIITNGLGADFTVANGLVITQLTPNGLGDLFRIDDLDGIVQGLDAVNHRFTLHNFRGDFLVVTDINTQFEMEGCAANNFSCLANGQVLDVDVRVLPGGVFFARRIELEDADADDELEGVVFRIDDATHFGMVVLNPLRPLASVTAANRVQVTLSNPQFQVRAHGLTVPSALKNAFEGATDTSQMLPGQVVQVRVNSANIGPPIGVTTNRIRLRFTQVRGTLTAAPIPPNFTIGTLPPLFTNAGITTIHVQTSGSTDFEGVLVLNGLLNGDIVSVRGLLFKNGVNPPELIAKKVRKR